MLSSDVVCHDTTLARQSLPISGFSMPLLCFAKEIGFMQALHSSAMSKQMLLIESNL